MENKYLNKFASLLYGVAIITFILAFNFTDNPPGGWYQQFMPDLNNRPISDITFTDSLTGYAITGDNSVGDTNYILKTNNGGDNWNIIHSVYRDLSRVIFLNQNTGYVCGGFNNTSGSYLVKTTDGGNNWYQINAPYSLKIDDMSILNEDTMWIVDQYFFYNIYKTENGGSNWELQYSAGGEIDKIYFVNNNSGFFSRNSALWHTTNSGLSWTQVQGESGFRDMYFADSLLGWRTTFGYMTETTDGGVTWTTQTLPSGGNIIVPGMSAFSKISRDSLWGIGGVYLYPNNQFRGIIYRTTNGGTNWMYQIPDTSIHISQYNYIDFTNQLTGWAYKTSPTGIHTVTGGESLFVNIKQLSAHSPENYHLKQNYPNPFNPQTKIKFDIPKSSDVKLIIFDLLGRQVSILVNERLSPGSYEYTFDGRFAARQGSSATGGLPSGIYFYTLRAGEFKATKRMMLLK